MLAKVDACPQSLPSGEMKVRRYESHSDTSHFVLISLIGVVLLIRLSDGKLVSWFFIQIKNKIEKKVNDAEGEKHRRILVGIKDWQVYIYIYIYMWHTYKLDFF